MNFRLTDDEYERASAWIDAHRTDGRPTGASGGRFTYTFTPTTLGMILCVVDNVTHETLDLTDYSEF